MKHLLRTFFVLSFVDLNAHHLPAQEDAEGVTIPSSLQNMRLFQAPHQDSKGSSCQPVVLNVCTELWLLTSPGS